MKVWCLLVLLRIAWTILPQTGYIHPDEFFQSVEIVAGDILQVDAYRSWEFNTSKPIRSIVVPYLTTALPLQLLQFLKDQGYYQLTAYNILVGPRIMMTLLSLLLDYSLWRICNTLQVDPNPCLLLHSTSYITFTYLTRTFSNSVECLLFSGVLLVVVSLWQKIFVPASREFSSDKWHRHIHNSGGVANKYSLALVVTLGIFNRPTFILFSLLPLLLWLGCISMGQFSTFKLKSLLFMILCLQISTAFILVDSLYYKTTFNKLIHEITNCFTQQNLFSCIYVAFSQNTVITPVNFISYNLQSSNLAKHGVHPFYLHFLVNSFLLFGPLYALMIYRLFNSCLLHFWSFVNFKSKFFDINFILSLFFIVPVFLLSVFPHQEPRFLTPLLPVVILLTGLHFKTVKHKKILLTIWILYNTVFGYIYGRCHQGGVIPVLLYLQKHLANNPITTGHHMIFFHTYMPPKHLLLLDSDQAVMLIDLKGSGHDVLYHVINKIQNSANSSVIYLAIPASVSIQPKETAGWQLLETFFPHLSMEDPPSFNSDLLWSISWKKLGVIVEHFLNSCSLNLFKIS